MKARTGIAVLMLGVGLGAPASAQDEMQQQQERQQQGGLQQRQQQGSQQQQQQGQRLEVGNFYSWNAEDGRWERNFGYHSAPWVAEGTELFGRDPKKTDVNALRQQGAQQLTGQIDKIRMPEVAREGKHLIALLKTQDGKEVVVDLGSKHMLQQQGLQKLERGDQVAVIGNEWTVIDGRPILLVEVVRTDDGTFTAARGPQVGGQGEFGMQGQQGMQQGQVGRGQQQQGGMIGTQQYGQGGFGGPSLYGQSSDMSGQGFYQDQGSLHAGYGRPQMQGQQDMHGQQGMQGRQQGQFGQQQQQGQLGQQQRQQQRGMGRQLLQGQIFGIDFSKGVIRLNTQQGVVDVRATPSQMGGMQTGQTITIPVAEFGGQPWIANGGTFTGPVSDVNYEQGVIVIRGQAFFTHPEVLSNLNLSQGQRANVQFEELQGVPWILEIEVQPTQGSYDVGQSQSDIGYGYQQQGDGQQQQPRSMRTIKGEIGRKRNMGGRELVELRTDEGQTVLLDLGEERLEELDLDQGARVLVRGRMSQTQMGGQPVLRVEGFQRRIRND